MAVSGLRGGALTLVVLVLVPLVIDPSLASCACIRWNEFDRIVKQLNDTLKNCPQDCNSTQIIDRKCHCLNLITSENCVFPAYLISGLKAVNRTLPASWQYIQWLINKLNHTHQNCMDKSIAVPLTCHSSVSPQSFFNTMNDVKQYIQSEQVQRRFLHCSPH